ncbi:MAG: hypothetical protein JWN48_5812 [Myxococcaceae bacterium]|nr:hypothetical protein [Myxococcaceae bacterium]
MRAWCSGASLAWMLGTSALWLGAGVVTLASDLGVAHAQSTPQQLAEANKRAMEDYNNLDVERSKAALEKAAKNAEKNGIRGPALARTYSNLAVVLIGGMGDQKGAISAFARALKEDPKLEPDPIVATPEVVQAYNTAKSNNAKGVAVEQEEQEEAPAERVQQGPVEGNLDHTPAAEQLAQTAIPIFVKKSDDLNIASVKVFYRSLGMKKPQSKPLTETDDGYTYLIPCTDVFEPKVEYFIVATDSEGKPVGNAGTSEAPIAVPVVSERTTEAPSLPGQVPPTQCKSDDECPPGSPGCGGAAGMGDSCSADSDCQSGLICDDDFCVSGKREGQDEEEEESSSSRKSIGSGLFVTADIGVTMVAVGSGKAPDRSARGVLDPVRMQATTPNGLDLAVARRALQARGYDCTATAVGANMDGLQLTNCAVAVHPGGIVALPVLNVGLGYHVTPALAAAVTGRIQLGHGEGKLAGIQLGLRGEYTLTKPFDKGFLFTGLGGFGVGQIQARPHVSKGKDQGPYATNAKLGGVGFSIDVGAKAGYRISKSFALNVTPLMHFGLPNFLFALDLMAGGEVNF